MWSYVACVSATLSSKDTVGTQKVPNSELHCSKGLRSFWGAEYFVGTVRVLEPLQSHSLGFDEQGWVGVEEDAYSPPMPIRSARLLVPIRRVP